MHAAVVRAFDHPPRFEEFTEPVARAGHETVVDVLAAGLHPRVRSGAAGIHYTSDGELPLIPGVDGVGSMLDGDLVYFVLPDTAMGSMSERTTIDRRRSATLDADTDVAVIAAGMNPAMSSWIALRRRIDFAPGSRVLVLGATGNAGQLAIQIAKHLGAGQVIGAGRNAERLDALPALGADATVSLEGQPDEVAAALGEAASEVDVVIDYLWGEPSQAAIPALLRRRSNRSVPITWIQIGAIAGPDISLPSAALRSANLQVIGSGQGSVGTASIVEELPELAAALSAGSFAVNPVSVPLSDVEDAWSRPAEPGARTVFIP